MEEDLSVLFSQKETWAENDKATISVKRERAQRRT
jgi:hypothetical protein